VFQLLLELQQVELTLTGLQVVVLELRVMAQMLLVLLVVLVVLVAAAVAVAAQSVERAEMEYFISFIKGTQ
jgi:hypothetical protein